MDYNNFREKIYYMNLKDIVLYILFTLSIFIVFIEFSFFNKDVAYDLLRISGLIIIMISLTFSIHIKSMTGREIYGLAQIFLLINFIVFLVSLSPQGQFNSFKILFDDMDHNGVFNFNFTNTIILYYLIARYRKDESNRKIIYIEYIIWIFITCVQSYFLKTYPSWKLCLLNLLFNLAILLLSYKNIYIHDFDSKGKIDLLKLNLLFASIRFGFMIISNVTLISWFNTIGSMSMQVVIVSTMIAIIFNITKENYNFVFKETIMTSKHLEEINRKIIKSNYKLEDTYKKLSDKQRLYKTFLDSLPNPIVIVNNSLRISYCNMKFLNEVRKKNIRDVVNRRIDNYIDFNHGFDMENCFDSNSGPHTTTIDLNGKKVEVRFFNFNNEDPECILIFKDLTEEIKLSYMKEELEDIRIREELKKNFLSNISHDLKIPVNVIYSAIQLEKVLMDNNDIERIRFYNEISKENCFILTKFTNNLIDISKIDSENLKVNLSLDNIVEFIEDYLFSLSPYVKNSGLDIIFDTSEEEIYTYFDKEMMQRVILNLVSNSIKFTKIGGIISVKIEDLRDYVLIELGDNGVGMSSEFISKAFNKYEMESRYKNNNATGFGVGLFVVYNLIKAQNGDIKIQSKLGKGTNFIIKLYKQRVF